MTTEKILDYDIDIDSLDQCLDVIRGWIEAGKRGRVFVCANPHSLVQAAHDPLFQQAIRSADLVTPDGAGIILASKILGGKVRHRVTGSDIFWGLSEILNKSEGMSYFFLGSTEETLWEIKRKMAVEYPRIRFAGSYSPPYKSEFSEEDSRKMVEAVNAARPDVLWVGMTAPKQEKWIHLHRDQLDVKFIGAIGAVFDFYVGNVKRSHPVFQSMGLEWLPRLVQEPRRLWRRNFISSPLFLLYVLRQRLFGQA
ncbi:MAG: WecB/TagA/CpsF family glycosyltransferase [Desulfococcus multivorans]|nr:WecB/TagA/CpsF family glycosyltransferase [Desulfococcus multivorans]